jgi:hypothetical protein
MERAERFVGGSLLFDFDIIGYDIDDVDFAS